MDLLCISSAQTVSSFIMLHQKNIWLELLCGFQDTFETTSQTWQ
jgi:hypothetical protein